MSALVAIAILATAFVPDYAPATTNAYKFTEFSAPVISTLYRGDANAQLGNWEATYIAPPRITGAPFGDIRGEEALAWIWEAMRERDFCILGSNRDKMPMPYYYGLYERLPTIVNGSLYSLSNVLAKCCVSHFNSNYQHELLFGNETYDADRILYWFDGNSNRVSVAYTPSANLKSGNVIRRTDVDELARAIGSVEDVNLVSNNSRNYASYTAYEIASRTTRGYVAGDYDENHVWQESGYVYPPATGSTNQYENMNVVLRQNYYQHERDRVWHRTNWSESQHDWTGVAENSAENFSITQSSRMPSVVDACDFYGLRKRHLYDEDFDRLKYEAEIALVFAVYDNEKRMRTNYSGETYVSETYYNVTYTNYVIIAVKGGAFYGDDTTKSRYVRFSTQPSARTDAVAVMPLLTLEDCVDMAINESLIEWGRTAQANRPPDYGGEVRNPNLSTRDYLTISQWVELVDFFSFVKLQMRMTGE